jgi:branched-chain amino acid transport system substrate-binding protein
MAAKGHKKVVAITWKYAAGEKWCRLQGGLREGRRQGRQGADLPFPNVEFQALLTEIAAARPDAVFCSSPAAARSSSSRTTPPPA